MQVSALNPASPEAGHLLWLWNACLWVCYAILAIVTASLIYIPIRFRGRNNVEPSQTTGSRKLEIAWTVVPILLVMFLFVASVVTTGAVYPDPGRKPDIIVTGHQWWWEVRYPAANVYTANEVHIPVGRDLLVGVKSSDVAHDFWVPRLGPKMDAIPGRENTVFIRADSPGVYRGFCAEFCGDEHAWMLFRVVAQSPADYDAWLAEQARPAVAPGGGDAAQGSVLFRQMTCANCHNITGLNAQHQFAPDLTHLASRRMLAGERLENTSDNLRQWLHQPNILKPGCYMPDLKLTDQQLRLLTAYLETLK